MWALLVANSLFFVTPALVLAPKNDEGIATAAGTETVSVQFEFGELISGEHLVGPHVCSELGITLRNRTEKDPVWKKTETINK